MIILDQENKLITLHTKNTTYQMKVWDYNVLLHSYYGPRISGGDLSYLLRCKDRGFPPTPMKREAIEPFPWTRSHRNTPPAAWGISACLPSHWSSPMGAGPQI